ncbi:MAG: Sarcosine oxidase alpha subunit [uncultured Rubrobacteraceae bacterium]|uniref:Sarcosine oxidase alpha subunit n=1 Tax=uncultured Rubrobacteraceae bacterium TaxID=349277 RepID=A0A6J4RH09_9ACTN|nr:MAG: Sarcosine oxidase alpha subunit [uncultured Rubrobacteraceae bacterium]
MSMRLDHRPGEVIDRQREFTFTWNGEEYPAYGGDTIISALAACGERIFSRSFKYHRPRGLLTASFLDPGCMVQVDDEPNVRGAHRRVEPGMVVSPQGVWPSLEYDVKSANGAFGRFLSAGFYYKTFIKPRRLWPVYRRMLRRFSAGGTVSASPAQDYFDKRYAHPDVLVAGGGPAGMAAAVAAARAGAQVLLVEEEYELGGYLRWGDEAELAALRALREEVASSPGIEVMPNSVVEGRYDDNWVAVMQRDLSHVEERLVKARAKTLVVAPGLIERPYVFEGNDTPGVILSTAARRLINLYAVKPGERAVVFSANESGDAAAEDLARSGVEVARVVDARRGGDIVRVKGGGKGVRAVECSDGAEIECDLLVTAVGWTAPTSLINMAGDRPVYNERAARFFSSHLPDDVLTCGGIAGDGTLEELIEHARATGGEAARRAAKTARRLRGGIPLESEAPPAEISELPLYEHPALFRGKTHGIVDYSEDVTSKDLVTAEKEGYDSIELVKRYTTVTMGPAQGKLESVNAVAIMAETTGRTIEETGTTVWRPPYSPVTLGALAGRIFEPVRYSPMQPWHEIRGAKPLVAGAWIRPDHYGDPASEVLNVRENVGIIDVTPLGKFDLRGPDVPKLLNHLYVNRWDNLEEGRVRYGVMCLEDGVVFDDGVTGRLGPEWYVMTTTSSGAAGVGEWIDNWLQTAHPGWRIHVTPVTTAYASINVAGPKSRELLLRLTEGVDLSPDAFPYMRVREGRVAGVEGCFMWRLGFTGELSYEVHVPAAYGLHVWETLMQRGADLGVGPFGVEAQRILRLEKGHFIVGQDTDGLTGPYDVGLGRMVKLDKDDFTGKPELAWQSEINGRLQLVGLQPHDGSLVPPEASQIVEGESEIVGRITSSRMSPTLGRSICLGFVAEHLTTPGTKVVVQLPGGERVPASVTPHHAHYDPEGTRQRG